jgi:hypothetical protein
MTATQRLQAWRTKAIRRRANGSKERVTYVCQISKEGIPRDALAIGSDGTVARVAARLGIGVRP